MFVEKNNQGQLVLLRLQENHQRSELLRRMPCEKNTQVAGTLVQQESCTLRSNQLVNEEFHKNDSKPTIFRKDPFFIYRDFFT
jgi:hypothetical protein